MSDSIGKYVAVLISGDKFAANFMHPLTKFFAIVAHFSYTSHVLAHTHVHSFVENNTRCTRCTRYVVHESKSPRSKSN